MKRNTLWGTRLGIYFAAVGSAVGLGNIWRFPYIVSENGGGAFVLLYVFLALIVGVPVLIGEFMLGRLTRKGILATTSDILSSSSSKNKPLWMKRVVSIGSYLMIIVAFLMIAYLTVISSWVLFFLVQFSRSLFVELSVPVDQFMSSLRSDFLFQIILSLFHMFLVVSIVSRGIEDHFEKWVSYLVPFFSLILIILAAKSLSLNLSFEALQYFLYPDFSKLNLSSMSYALGHIFFTLGVGLGLTISFGRYLSSKTSIPLTGFRVTTIDSTVSIFAGLLVFPLVFSGVYGGLADKGPELLFDTVPQFLFKIYNGKIFGLGLFLCLYVSAIGACVGLLETIVSNIKEVKSTHHIKISWWAGSVGFVLSLLVSLLFSYWPEVRLAGKSLFQVFDMVLVNILLPITSLIVLFLVYYFIDNQTRKLEFFGEKSNLDQQLYGQWLFAVKWLIPIVYCITFSLLIYALA